MTPSVDDLLSTVKRLASPPDEQEAYLRQLGTRPSLDELALEFDEEYQRLRQQQREVRPPVYLAALQALDVQLDAMSGENNSKLWTAEALHHDEWTRVRALAREALAARPRTS